ncbi:MAG: acetolactate synthase large subunit [Nitrospirota bacterium]
MTAAELFVRCLEAEGVEYIFGLPGEENLDLLDALSRSPIRFIPTRHEQGAAFMADVYGRLTGRAGVCLATLGPGATNLATGIGDANLDHAPLVAITGQAGLERVHKESHQYVNIVEAFAPLTKWNTRVERASVIPEVVRHAFKTAQAEKPGACHVELPEDVAGETVQGSPLTSRRTRRPSPDRPSLRAAAERIDAARHPIILAGNGVIRGRAAAELAAFAEKTAIPVANTFMAKGALPADHPLSLLSIGLQAKDFVSCGFAAADLIVTVGYDQVEYAPYHWNSGGDKPIVHVDFTPAETDAMYQPEVEVVSDVREALELLRGEVTQAHDRGYPRRLREAILRDLERDAAADAVPLKPARVLRDLRGALGRSDVVISDVGAHKLLVARLFPAYEPNTVLISNGFASMGIALPGAIAASMIRPERRVVAVCGDGGFLMNVQELETAVRLGVAFVVVVFRDEGYGLIRWKQQRQFGAPFGIAFGNPDIVRLAESFGARGYRVERADDFGPLLKDALAQRVPAVIDVPVDYRDGIVNPEQGKIICPT